MKKLFAVLLAVLMVFTLAGCSSAPAADDAATDDAASDLKTVYIMGPTPDHGWTAQAGAYAEAKAKEIAGAGEYNSVYIPASSGEEQCDQITQIIANGDAAVVVMMALDDTAASGQEALYAAGIPFISFDRIIEATEKYAILNASGDNWQCGAGIGYWLTQHGMVPGDTAVILWGDNGTVCTRRQEGFEQFLKGEIDYNDKNNGTFHIETPWTAEEVAALCANYSAVVDPNWSKDGAVSYIEPLLADIVDTAANNTGKLFIYSMDDEMTFGVLNVLENVDATDADLAAKAEGLEIYISAIGGMQELYNVMSGKDAQSAIADKYFDDMMSMYFSPKMMQDVIDRGLDFLSGNWDVEVGSGEYQPVFIVDRTTAGSTEGFTGH